MDINKLKDILRDGGIVGAGGAGFPTYAKLSEKAETVILNGAECEPLIKVDRQLMSEYVEEILTGMQLLVEAMNASEGIIAVKKSYTAAIGAIESSISEYTKLKLHILPDIYPAGDEVVLIYETTKKIVPQGKIPIETGCVVVNVETVYNIYKKVTMDENVTEKFITVAGLVNNPITVEVPLGITVRELIEIAGGITAEEYAMIMGGPMTGCFCNMRDVVTKTTKAILVLPPECPPVKKRQLNSRQSIRNAMSACSQCSMCTTLCPRNLLGQSIKPHEFMRSIANGVSLQVEPLLNSFFCCSCGLCEMYACHQDLSPRSLLDAYKAGLKEKGVKIPDKAGKGIADPLREEQRVPEHRLIQRLGLHKFDKKAPLQKGAENINEVKLLLSQNIGAPCIPEVSIGDSVVKGQKIASPSKEALGVCLHASISGNITEVTERYIKIKSQGE